MNELMFYGGLVLSGILLILSAVLFFYFKVYSSISFFSGRGRKYVPAKKSKVKSMKKITEQQVINDEVTEVLAPSEDYTEILCDDESTEILE